DVCGDGLLQLAIGTKPSHRGRRRPGHRKFGAKPTKLFTASADFRQAVGWDGHLANLVARDSQAIGRRTEGLGDQLLRRAKPDLDCEDRELADAVHAGHSPERPDARVSNSRKPGAHARQLAVRTYGELSQCPGQIRIAVK